MTKQKQFLLKKNSGKKKSTALTQSDENTKRKDNKKQRYVSSLFTGLDLKTHTQHFSLAVPVTKAFLVLYR